MARRRLLLVVAAVAVASFIVRWALARPQADPLDPLRVAGETHRLALENAFVRVLDVHLPPGRVEPRHRHPHGLSVYFTDWKAKVTVDGKPPDVHARQAGTFAWNEAVVHSVENVGRTEGHILRIELKL